ncbi:unnamed protein product, partial [Discosporangium mesarthrocarpum]
MSFMWRVAAISRCLKFLRLRNALNDNQKVWRRQRRYVLLEVSKESPQAVRSLGFATGFTLIVGLAEGALLSAIPGDLRFPIRYALYNAIPSFVGQKVRPQQVVGATVSSGAEVSSVLTSCPRAASRAAVLQALRTAVAGCTAAGVLMKMVLAVSRGTAMWESSVKRGGEMPHLEAYSAAGDRGSPVVRLCGIHGLESALEASRREGRAPVLPLVIAEDASRDPLPPGGRAAVDALAPHPAYLRVSPRKIFSGEEGWGQLAVSAVTSSGYGPQPSQARGGGGVTEEPLVVEVDTMSSGTPQSLLLPPHRPSATGAAFGPPGKGRLREKPAATEAIGGWVPEEDMEGGRWGLGLGKREVVVSAAVGEEAVVIDVRAALLSSVLTWAQQCAAEAEAQAERKARANNTTAAAAAAAAREGSGHSRLEASKPSTRCPPIRMRGGGGNERTDTWGREVTPGVGGGRSGSILPNPSEGGKGEEDSSGAGGAGEGSLDDLLDALGRVGRAVRVILTPDGRLITAALRPVGATLRWMLEGSEPLTHTPRVLVYDTDDEESFQWLAERAREGTITPPDTEEEDVGRGDGASLPVLVHRCTDEETLTSAASHLV